ncbi:von Willebrand factor A [Natrialba hulunbeirensis JCM 10989]|uniref:von Willebrand factor A n=2 Tax=Natrialba hulunbeirensis TaxID=123783 RepID=M0A1V4_9EURY|nr:von Willebrand factor A [Natrialba hulunbeirensis JCM 10989]
MVFMGAALVFAVGSGALDALTAQTHAEKTEQELKQFDSDLASVGWQNDTTETVFLGDGTQNKLVTDGSLTVNVSDGYNSNEERIPLETIVTTDESGNEYAYQAGGIWRSDSEYATAVSNPNIRYYTELSDGEQVGRLDLSPTTIQGSVGSGEHTVQSGQLQEFDLLGDELEYVNYVTVEVSETNYHNGWYDFLKEEFEATDEDNVSGLDCNPATEVTTNIICHNEDEQTVTVVAGVDGETPLANLVDVEPTVYGGLYIEGDENDFGSALEVTAYDNQTVGDRETNDIFLANYNEYDLKNNAPGAPNENNNARNTVIDGIPVVNGELGSQGNPVITQIGYGVSVDGKEIENNDGDTIYQLDPQEGGEPRALAAELSEPYDSIDEIDTEVDNLLTNYLNEKPAPGSDVSSGLYSDISSSHIDQLDSSNGDVHIGVENDLTLTDATVEGDNQTSFYVDGDITVSEVNIDPDDRANSLWIYGTSDSTIEIDGDFQGVIYAPGADIKTNDGVAIDGAVVAGDDVGIGDNVHVNFDRTLRTDTPFTDGDEDLFFEYVESRPPIDATFILDSSGSMGPHNIYGSVYDPITETEISGSDWETIPVDEPFRNTHSELGGLIRHDIEVRNTTVGETSILEYREDYADPSEWDEVRVIDETCFAGSCTNQADLGLYQHPGNDPSDQRVAATRHFLDLMNESEGDRAGVYEFDSNGRTLHHLTGDLEGVKDSVAGNGYAGTNMGAGLREALDDYETHGEEGQERIAILLSDGENSDSSGDALMWDQVERANENNVTLYTVGLDGLEHDPIPEDKLIEWAEATGGEFHGVDDSDDLYDLFEMIAREEIEVDAEVQVEISVTHERETTSGYAVNIAERTVELES